MIAVLYVRIRERFVASSFRTAAAAAAQARRVGSLAYFAFADADAGTGLRG